MQLFGLYSSSEGRGAGPKAHTWRVQSQDLKQIRLTASLCSLRHPTLLPAPLLQLLGVPEMMERQGGNQHA